jgi:predicted nucleotidyltransferase
MICPKCARKGLGPYLKTIKGNSYFYVAHYLGQAKVKWCYVPESILLNPKFFKDGKFIHVAELNRLIHELWEREGLSDLKIKKIYIHGSQVKGTYAKASDLDVWVTIEQGFEIPIVLTATKRMEAPPSNVPRLKLRGVEVEVSCSSLKPKPPYFDVFEQRLVLRDE